MNKTKWILNLGAVITLIGILSICVGIAFGHGEEKHDSTKTIETAPSDTLPSSESETLDLIYLAIQKEFVVLQPVFKKGCFDCHTTRTEFPWYYKVPLVKGMIDDDITEAKKHMDMSDGFPFGGHGKPVDDLVAIREEVQEGKMPPLSYRMMHWSAKPSENERDSIIAWVERSLVSLAAIGVVTTEPGSTNADAKVSIIYTCPMHPQITGDPEDSCSLCGIPLKVIRPDSLADSANQH